MSTVAIEILNVERSGEVRSKEVCSSCLQTLTVLHHCFHRIGCFRACKLFLFRLLTDKHGHCQNVLGKFFVNVQHF